MFSFGRYDPNHEVDDKKVTGKEERLTAPSNILRKKRRFSEKFDDSSSIDNDALNKGNKGGDGEDESSSSCPPSSDGSSSSAPSSDSDDIDDVGDIDVETSVITPAFQVIAPEQKIQSIDVMRKTLNTTNEGIDDFDYDQESQLLMNQSDEINKALKISKLGIKEAAKIWNLAPFLVDNLERDDYKSFFPIQALVIPDVIASERYAHIRNRDVCVSSPTGSGKTLAFVIPVLNALAKRRIRRLRALVVLPSRDLGEYLHQADSCEYIFFR